MKSEESTQKNGLLTIQYKKPNYESLKHKVNFSEARNHVRNATFDDLQKRTDIAWIASSQGYIRDISKLTRKEPVTQVVNGEDYVSDIYYEIVDGGFSSQKVCYEFYYEMIPCEKASQICKQLVQAKHYTDESMNEDNPFHPTCSACYGTMFLSEPIDKEPVEATKTSFDSWYSASKPKKIISWGAGMDSTILILQYGFEADEIIMSDPDAEEIETYEYIKYFIEKLPRLIRDKITIVSNDREGSIDEWHFNKKLQPMPFANRQCTDKWKLRVIHRYLRRTYGTKAVFDMMVGINKDEQAERERPLPSDVELEYHIENVLGYDYEKLQKEASRQKISVEDYKERLRNALQTGSFNKKGEFNAGTQYARNVYPLCDEGIGKEQEKQIYEDMGIQIPPKSGCYFCPMKSKSEWKKLEDTHPDLYENTVRISENSTAKISIMEMSEKKKAEMRCACSNGVYEMSEEDKRYETKLVGRGL